MEVEERRGTRVTQLPDPLHRSPPHRDQCACGGGGGHKPVHEVVVRVDSGEGIMSTCVTDGVGGS